MCNPTELSQPSDRAILHTQTIIASKKSPATSARQIAACARLEETKQDAMTSKYYHTIAKIQRCKNTTCGNGKCNT